MIIIKLLRTAFPHPLRTLSQSTDTLHRSCSTLPICPNMLSQTSACIGGHPPSCFPFSNALLSLHDFSALARELITQFHSFLMTGFNMSWTKAATHPRSLLPPRRQGERKTSEREYVDFFFFCLYLIYSPKYRLKRMEGGWYLKSADLNCLGHCVWLWNNLPKLSGLSLFIYKIR